MKGETPATAGPVEARFFSRELSWLEFNQRVLNQSLDPEIPLMERVKFLAITASNLDEFFMVRVGGLKLLLASGTTSRDHAGLTPREQLDTIAGRVARMTRDQYACFQQDISRELEKAGIHRVVADSLTPEQRCHLDAQFKPMVFSILTPMAVQHDAPSPLLPGLALHMLVRLAPGTENAPRFAILPLGPSVPRLVPLPGDAKYTFTLIEDAVRSCLPAFFAGETVLEATVFRLTRNADMGVQDEDAADFMAEMQQVLDDRRQSGCVRIEVESGASDESVSFLAKMLGAEARDIQKVPGPLNLADLMSLASLDGFENLRDQPWPPQPSPDAGAGEDLFDALRRRDILLCHPFDSFDPVQTFVEAAAADPQVLAIKQILYRTSRQSPIVAALRHAAERGKYVTALVELKARFDEARNIEWARELERTGVKVVYGVKGLKTHAKLCLVVRREPGGIVRYAHFGTGNYNETTARLYTDVSLLTSKQDFTSDAAAFFNAITGYSQPLPYLKLVAAPAQMRGRLIELIEGEAERSRQGQEARILAKMNSLADREIIKALYEASQAGVEIRLNVRGICCLRPGVPGLSDRIAVVSIVDRYLEHSRIFLFHHGGDEQLFISSADWMPRNLDRRIELMTPVEDSACRRRLVSLLKTCLQDTAKGFLLQPDGAYTQARPGRGQKSQRSQKTLYEQACRRVEEERQAKRTVFEPHQSSDDSKT
jgi:polyphosphate kinase